MLPDHALTKLGLLALLLLSSAAWPVRAEQQAAAGVPDTAPSEAPATASADAGSGLPEAAGPAVEEPFPDVLHNRRLTGDWGGVRTRLEELGIEWNLTLSVLYQHNARGGLDTRSAHRINGRADMELSLSTEPMGLWPGGQLYVCLLYTSPSPRDS